MVNKNLQAALARRALSVIFLGTLLVGILPAAGAANLCPWMNEATASGLLGASATGTYAAATGGRPAVCTFVATEPRGTRSLTINVEEVQDAHERMAAVLRECIGEASAVAAIGNEASVCTANERKDPASELLAGRVRNQVFSITIKTTLRNDPTMDQSVLRSKVLIAAEQVSGNLF